MRNELEQFVGYDVLQERLAAFRALLDPGTSVYLAAVVPNPPTYLALAEYQ